MRVHVGYELARWGLLLGAVAIVALGFCLAAGELKRPIAAVIDLVVVGGIGVCGIVYVRRTFFA